ncbi:hypothetical protein DU500_01290 [Haloplanus rubicundus]|uniref:Uncharacterized protein n=1 Tax=Haloplanus rubicundus TaxID=1547898 RepID=A0A345DYZ4_9EURY|nr:hypothetical protein [Haloplanus rubicundus]AXG05166.1 hypothetical protein DU500_01290 [Haloplanus rubicundus]
MALPLGSRDIVPLFGALVVGFALFLVVGYLALFDVATFDSDLVLVEIGVVVGYVGARVAGEWVA